MEETKDGRLQGENEKRKATNCVEDRGEKWENSGLRVITAEVTILHHEQFVDRIVHGRVQALRQRRGLVRWRAVMGMRGALMAAVRATAVVLADVEAAVRTVQGQVAAAETLPRVSRIRVWNKARRVPSLLLAETIDLALLMLKIIQVYIFNSVKKNK